MPNKPVINRENLRWLLTQPTDVKLAMLESHLDICRLLVKEVLEETLTLHRIGMTELIRGFGTTNCIENLNSLLERTTRNVKRWTNSIQRHRWVAAGLLEAEHRMRKIDNYGRLSALQRAVSTATREKNFN
jgi:hypothetical protein